MDNIKTMTNKKETKEVDVTLNVETEADTEEEAIENAATLIDDALFSQGLRPQDLFNMEVKN